MRFYAECFITNDTAVCNSEYKILQVAKSSSVRMCRCCRQLVVWQMWQFKLGDRHLRGDTMRSESD